MHWLRVYGGVGALGPRRPRLRLRLPQGPWTQRTETFFSFAVPGMSREALVKSHRETKRVPFAPEELYDVVADVDRYHEFLPFCVDSRVLRRPNENVMEAQLRVGFKVFTEAYTSRVIMKRPEKIVIKSIESPTFKRIESEWAFRRVPGMSNACDVDFRVTFEVASFLHANAIKLFFEDVAVTQLNAFIGRTAKLQSQRTRGEAERGPRRRRETPLNGAAVVAAPVSQGTTGSEAATAHAVAQGRAASTATDNASMVSATTTSPTRCVSPAILQRAASLIREDVWSQDYGQFRQIFEKHAVDRERLYFGGFVKACRELGYEYEDCKHIGENSALAGAIFSSFETSSTPKDWLNLDEFAVGVYLMTKGTVEEKAHTLFHIIDTSEDGKISREELTTAMRRRIRTVKKIFPKLLTDQVEMQMASANVPSLQTPSAVDEAVAKGLHAIEGLMEEIEKDIPLAVNQIFLEADLDQDDYITEDEWLFAWQAHPEFVELMTIDGMKKVAQWASVVHPRTIDGEGDTRLTHVD